ncbi:MAG: DegT/DnrJ/EryC1/StrS family aminotransferase [bacterium]|jgi:dTDP-4-amino-4,6-dideoxygalactose transaminase|nr:DegT/DnrJ/EryC1/StrS family aminotransferase [bacterium]
MRESFLVFGAPSLTEDDLEALIATFRSGWIGTGPAAAALEQQFAQYKQIPHAVALSSCTAALHLAMIAIGIQPGDEVITTPMTFCATANAILHAGGVPVFADIDPYTGLISPEEIEKKITPKTKALLPVHLCGRPCAMETLQAIALEHHLAIIEDCAHAIETLYHGQPAGTLGDAGCFSFYVTKNITAIEGGMVTTANRALADQIKTLALHGLSADAWKRFSDSGYKHYETVALGYKYNLPDVHAALALQQLKRIEANWQRRQAIWAQYDEAFQDLPCLIPPPQEENTRHARHLYTLLLDLDRLRITRDQFMDQLQQNQIGCGVHYLSLHLHSYYRDRYHFQPLDFPNALWHSDRTLSLPLSPALQDEDIADVIAAVRHLLLRHDIG